MNKDFIYIFYERLKFFNCDVRPGKPQLCSLKITSFVKCLSKLSQFKHFYIFIFYSYIQIRISYERYCREIVIAKN